MAYTHNFSVLASLQTFELMKNGGGQTLDFEMWGHVPPYITAPTPMA